MIAALEPMQLTSQRGFMQDGSRGFVRDWQLNRIERGGSLLSQCGPIVRLFPLHSRLIHCKIYVKIEENGSVKGIYDAYDDQSVYEAAPGVHDI
jgi:hypothetical protein